MTTAEQLTQVFYDNFMAYFRSHAAHVNITGRNFQSDHTLLEGIYDSLQDQIDFIGELLRTLDEYMPCDIYSITDNTGLPTTPIEGSSDELLELVKEDLEHLKGCYEELMAVSTAEGHEEIANYSQDRVLGLAKQIWMLNSTLS